MEVFKVFVKTEKIECWRLNFPTQTFENMFLNDEKPTKTMEFWITKLTYQFLLDTKNSVR